MLIYASYAALPLFRRFFAIALLFSCDTAALIYFLRRCRH